MNNNIIIISTRPLIIENVELLSGEYIDKKSHSRFKGMKI